MERLLSFCSLLWSKIVLFLNIEVICFLSLLGLLWSDE